MDYPGANPIEAPAAVSTFRTTLTSSGQVNGFSTKSNGLSGWTRPDTRMMRNGRVLLPDAVCQRQPVAARHLDIGDQQIHIAFEPLHDLPGRVTALRFERQEIFALQDGSDISPNVSVVINDQG